MYDRFTDRARKVMQLANQEAQRFNHEHIHPGHVLLGMLKEGNGCAAIVLQGFDLSIRRVRIELEKIKSSAIAQSGRLPHTEVTKAVIDEAIRYSREVGNNHVGTEHMLVGLIRISHTMFLDLSVDPVLVLEAVKTLILSAAVPSGMIDGKKTIAEVWKTEVLGQGSPLEQKIMERMNQILTFLETTAERPKRTVRDRGTATISHVCRILTEAVIAGRELTAFCTDDDIKITFGPK